MGLLLCGNIAFYSIGAAGLGNLGGINAWRVLMAMIAITANLWGAIASKWVKVGRRSFAYLWADTAVLLVVAYVISFASRVSIIEDGPASMATPSEQPTEAHRKKGRWNP
jgi:hypothetical protein